MKLPVSVLIQTKNEELAIAACIHSLEAFSEVVVVDSNSTDRTIEIAKSCGAEVVNFTWDGSYPKKKQWQLDNVSASNEWVLLLDADEQPSVELIAELQGIFSRTVSVDAFDVELLYWFAGHPLKYGHKVVKRALMKRGRARFPVFDDLGLPGSWEVEGHYQPQVAGKVVKLKSKLMHVDPDPVASWLERHNRYSSWEANIRVQNNLRLSMRASKSGQGRIFDMLPFQPLIFFLYSYLLRRGFMDGRPGFDYAIALATYYWAIGLKVRELSTGGGHAI